MLSKVWRFPAGSRRGTCCVALNVIKSYGKARLAGGWVCNVSAAGRDRCVQKRRISGDELGAVSRRTLIDPRGNRESGTPETEPSSRLPDLIIGCLRLDLLFLSGLPICLFARMAAKSVDTPIKVGCLIRAGNSQCIRQSVLQRNHLHLT